MRKRSLPEPHRPRDLLDTHPRRFNHKARGFSHTNSLEGLAGHLPRGSKEAQQVVAADADLTREAAETERIPECAFMKSRDLERLKSGGSGEFSGKRISGHRVPDAAYPGQWSCALRRHIPMGFRSTMSFIPLKRKSDNRNSKICQRYSMSHAACGSCSQS